MKAATKPSRTMHRPRSTFVQVLLPIWITISVFAPGLAAQNAAVLARPESVGAIVISDMDRSVDFYSQVLTFEKLSDTEVYGDSYEHLEGVFGARMRVVRMRLGEEQIELTEFLTPRGRPIPLDSRSNDLWFQHIAIVTSDMDRAYQFLRDHKIKYASTAPQLLPAYIKNAAGIRAFYFCDPDNHVLETLQFPPDKGDVKWHRTSDRVFLGIDHTAIVVGDTEASLKFYRDTLGMHITGESENYGSEQEHLNSVFGARLHITSLRADAGPGIELLEYLVPRDGRPVPIDSRTDDLWSWQTTILTAQADSLAKATKDAKYQLASSGLVALPTPDLEFRQGELVRDPDGHLMRIVQR